MFERSIDAPSPSMSCAEASPAKTSALPEPARASTASARACGESSSASLARWDPATSSWRTSQRCLFEGWERFSASWPRAGSMRRGTAYPRRPSAPLTAATGSSWSRGEYPTPSATPYGSAQNEGTVPHNRPTRGTPSLDTWARKGASWPTPTASMSTPADLEQARYWSDDPRRKSYAEAARAPWGGARREGGPERSERGEERESITRAGSQAMAEAARCAGDVLADSDRWRLEIERIARRQPGDEGAPWRVVDGRRLPLWPPGSDDLDAWARIPAEAQPALRRVADGPAGRMDTAERRARLHALGNAIVPAAVEVVGRLILAAERERLRALDELAPLSARRAA